MRVLLLSAYAATSHEYWRQRLLSMFSSWEWTCLTLPPRHFSWRVRGNPLYWSVAEREQLTRPYDLVIATSMVDLATLRGLVPELATVPTVIYFHENQFEYPLQPGQAGSLEGQMVSLYSALAADQILFNSRYNRDSFFQGLQRLLTKLPDYVPDDIPALLKARASIAPVPIALESASGAASLWPSRKAELPARIVWVGRFEYDKAPERLLGMLDVLARCHCSFHLAVVGQQFRHLPECFEEIRVRFAGSLVHMGFLEDRATYYQLLREADFVVSTARHEFQGIAVGEAVAAGCTPVVPDRLAYKEFYPAQYRYESADNDPARECEAAAQLLMQLAQQRPRAKGAAIDAQDWSEAALLPTYRQAFSLAGCKEPG